MNEKTLIGQLAGGDTAALRKIIRAYSGYVHTVVKNLSRGRLTPEDIDELVSDVFYRLWSRRETLDPGLGLRPYLSAAARNAAKNRFRGAAPAAEDIDGLDIPLDLRIEEAAELGEAMRCLREGMETLSDGEREAFFRFYFYGEKTAVIAEKTGATQSSVNTRLHRARGKLKEYLKERGFDDV